MHSSFNCLYRSTRAGSPCFFSSQIAFNAGIFLKIWIFHITRPITYTGYTVQGIVIFNYSICHYTDVKMGAIASQITSLTIVYRLFRHRSKKTFPAQIASNAENVPIWWRHHVPTHATGRLPITSTKHYLGLYSLKKTPSYGYRIPHYKPETVWWPSQVYNGNYYTNKMASF